MRVCIVNNNYLELAVDLGPVDHNITKNSYYFMGLKKIMFSRTRNIYLV